MPGGEGAVNGEIPRRFEILKKLGEGGMGVVYEAYDSKREATVAVKLMKNVAPEALYRFKKEFRSLSDMSHRNLVALFELISTSTQWLFTMELIRGTTLREHIRPVSAETEPTLPGDSRLALGSNRSSETNERTATMVHVTPARLSRLGARTSRPPLGNLDEGRLRAALPQLATGICALHDTRRLHRDIKPSNVLVDSDGRVVVCDFGLVHELTDATRNEPTSYFAAGTASYMSPEQARGERLTEASDWYSFGAVLYELLAGRPPFIGRREEIIDRKCSHDPTPVLRVNPAAPRDLAELCDELVRRDPGERIGRAGLLAALDMGTTPVSTAAAVEPPGSLPFVGRRAELAALRAAYDRAGTGRATAAMLSGPSGVGKSAIVGRFLDELGSAGIDVVLTGRCYQRESVAYKAFDDVVDALGDHLLTLSAPQVDAVLPADIGPLAQLFPALRRVEAIELQTAIPVDIPDAHELRRRAFSGLRAMLHAICAERRVVIAVDDLQWGDADSGHLLRALLRSPDPPPILLIATYRDGDRSSSPLLTMLLDGDDPLPDRADIPVAPLDAGAALELAACLTDSPEQSRTVAAGAAGNPFYVAELARYLRSGAEIRDDVSLESALAWRVGRLSEDERNLLAAVSVAGQPISLELAMSVARLEGDQRKAIARLRAEHLLRGVGSSADASLETFHDRVRETVVATMSPEELRARHLAFAERYEARDGVDPELVLEHWLGAGDDARAAYYAERAARQADESLAFDRAVRLYRLALDLGAPAEGRHELRVRLGDALVNVGRGAEAAEIYAECAGEAPPDEALELRRRAAHQWLYTGHFDRGVATVQQVLDVTNRRLAPTSARALGSLLWQRMWLRVRGLGFRECSPDEVSADELRKLDIYWTVASGLSLIDNIRGSDFQARYFRHCLRVGEPVRLAKGFALEAAFSGSAGSATTRRTERLLREAFAILERVDDSHALGFARLVAGICGFLSGRWADALQHCTEAEEVLLGKCTGVTWEIDAARWFGLGARFFLGELSEMSELVHAHLRDAETRGNLHATTNLRTWFTNTAWLLADDPDEAQRQIDIAEREWTRTGFHLQHHYACVAQTQLDLYRGDPDSALERVEAYWKPLGRSLHRQIQLVDVEANHLRARASLAVMARADGPDLRRRTAKDAKRIAAVGLPYAVGFAALIRAALDAGAERTDAALGDLDVAAAAFADVGMQPYVAACHWRRGQLVGDAESVADSRRRLEAMGARNPERLLGVLAPGFA